MKVKIIVYGYPQNRGRVTCFTKHPTMIRAISRPRRTHTRTHCIDILTHTSILYSYNI